MPEDGVALTPQERLLSDDEVARVARTFVDLGVTKIRLTGGEPMVRKGIVDIVGASPGLLAAVTDRCLSLAEADACVPPASPTSTGQLGRLKAQGLQQIGMTSNGISLHRKLPALVAAGLTHLNLSMDTLVPSKFPFLTRRPATYHAAVMQSLEAALALAPEGLTTKVNVVVMKGLNEDELAGFVELTRHKNVIVRFIEWMPFTGALPSSSLVAARGPVADPAVVPLLRAPPP